MARVEVSIRFLYDGVLYADTFGYIPRHEAIKIPELKVQENQTKTVGSHRLQAPGRDPSNKPSRGKKQSDMDEENGNENDDIEIEMDDPDAQNQNDGEADELDEESPDQELQEIENQDLPDNHFDEDEQEQDQEIDNDENDLSEISRSLSPGGGYSKYKTKRQKGQLDNFLELPLKKPRKDAKKFDQATQLLRKQEKQRKRRQYIKKLMQAQQKATFDKILNETGRKFRQRQQRQMKQQNQKDNKLYRTLGDVPKIIRKQTRDGTVIQVHRTQLFRPEVHFQPNVRMAQHCSVCSQAVGKYKAKTGQRFCSVACFKKLCQVHKGLVVSPA